MKTGWFCSFNVCVSEFSNSKISPDTKFTFAFLLQARNMIRDITGAFKGNLYDVKWMNNATRSQALAKVSLSSSYRRHYRFSQLLSFLPQVDAVTNMVGYPDYILNRTALDSEYEDVSWRIAAVPFSRYLHTPIIFFICRMPLLKNRMSSV